MYRANSISACDLILFYEVVYPFFSNLSLVTLVIFDENVGESFFDSYTYITNIIITNFVRKKSQILRAA